MRAKRNSIFVALLAIAHFISNNCSLADEIVNLQGAEPSSAGDVLQKQRLDEIRALTAMKNKAAADRDSRGKITSLIRETAENHATASAEVVARESSAKEFHESAEKAVKGLYHEKATEQVGEENHGTPMAESAAGTNIGDVDLDTRSIPEIMTIGSVLPDSVKLAVNGALESIEHVIQERIIPLMKEVVESIDMKPAEAVPDVAAGKFSDVTSNANEAAAVADAATNVVIDKVAPGADKVTLGADKVALGADKVTLGADKVTLGADKLALGADKVTLGADKVALGADKVTLGADKVTLGADKVTQGADKVTQGADKDAPAVTPSDILVEQTIFDTSSTISAMLDSVLPESHKAGEHVMQQSDQQEKITPVINQVKESTVPILQPIHTDSAKLDTLSNVESIQTPPVTPDDVVVVDKTTIDLMNTKRVEKDIEDIIDDSSEDDAMKEVI